MKYYITKGIGCINIHLLSTLPENIGYDKIDFENGAYIELPESLVELAESIAYMPDAYDRIFPARYYYIKSDKVLDMPEALSADRYNIGNTFDDYKAGAYVQLSTEQVHYFLHHRDSSIYEIYNLGVIPESIDLVRAQKLTELKSYDNSDAVNQFTINGVIPAWFTPEERSNYANSINAAELLGVETLSFYVGNQGLQVPTVSAKQMLAAIQLYADACYIVTKQHEAAIEGLNSIEEIKQYDITVGYPTKPNFDLV